MRAPGIRVAAIIARTAVRAAGAGRRMAVIPPTPKENRKMKITTLLAPAAIAAALLATPAFAEREDLTADPFMFMKMADADKDGMMSKQEAMKLVEKAFDKADANKRGKLDMKQLEQFLKDLMKGGA
jgi:hypothetical protein